VTFPPVSCSRAVFMSVSFVGSSNVVVSDPTFQYVAAWRRPIVVAP
jgi:hypothetical protein